MPRPDDDPREDRMNDDDEAPRRRAPRRYDEDDAQDDLRRPLRAADQEPSRRRGSRDDDGDRGRGSAIFVGAVAGLGVLALASGLVVFGVVSFGPSAPSSGPPVFAGPPPSQNLAVPGGVPQGFGFPVGQPGTTTPPRSGDAPGPSAMPGFPAGGIERPGSVAMGPPSPRQPGLADAPPSRPGELPQGLFPSSPPVPPGQPGQPSAMPQAPGPGFGPMQPERSASGLPSGPAERPPAAAQPAQDGATAALAAELRGLRLQLDALRSSVSRLEEAQSSAETTLQVQSASLRSILAQQMDLGGELAELRAKLDELEKRRVEAAAPPQPPPQPPPAAPMRHVAAGNHQRLVVTLPHEAVYEAVQDGNVVRVTFPDPVLPDPSRLPRSIKGVASLVTDVGAVEIRLAGDHPVRHAAFGRDVVIAVFDEGSTPPPSAGAPPRSARSASASGAAQAAPAMPVPPPAAVPPVPPAAPAAPPPAVSAAAAPQVARVPEADALAGWVLRSVSRRAVLVERNGETHRVELGATLPGTAIRALEVRRDGEVWVLVTSAGVLRP